MDKIRCEYCKQKQDIGNNACQFCGAQLPDVVNTDRVDALRYAYDGLAKLTKPDGVLVVSGITQEQYRQAMASRDVRQNVYSFAVAEVESFGDTWNGLEDAVKKALRDQ